MPVFRVERNKGYTVMSNYHLRDKSLSLKAKGLLSQILSLPEDWDYTLSGLCYINRENKDAICSAVNELERAGYIERHQTTDERSVSKRTVRACLKNRKRCLFTHKRSYSASKILANRQVGLRFFPGI